MFIEFGSVIQTDILTFKIMYIARKDKFPQDVCNNLQRKYKILCFGYAFLIKII